MDAKATRRLALDRQIKARKDDIIDAAICEFIENGIDNSKISDIAKRAEVGTITVYRYFETKPRLVIECATKLWKSEMETLTPLLFPTDFDRLNGYEQATHILEILGTLHEKCPVMLRLLEQFDNYVVKEHIQKEQLQQYEAGIIDTREMLLAAIRTGQADGSIRLDIDAIRFYATTTHAVIALSQKLLMRGDVIQSDTETDAKTQIALLIEMALYFIKGTKELC